MITGAQMLGLAQTLVGTQTIELFRFVTRAPNAAGKLVATYAAPVPLVCNFQPLPMALYERYGLDFNKTFFTLVAADDIGDISRGEDGDRVAFFGRLYACESGTPWFGSDGYSIILCADIGPAS